MMRYDTSTHAKQQNNHHFNQLNSNNAAYKAVMDNRSNQLNPNNSEYKGRKEQDELKFDGGFDNLVFHQRQLWVVFWGVTQMGERQVRNLKDTVGRPRMLHKKANCHIGLEA